MEATIQAQDMYKIAAGHCKKHIAPKKDKPDKAEKTAKGKTPK